MVFRLVSGGVKDIVVQEGPGDYGFGEVGFVFCGKDGF